MRQAKAGRFGINAGIHENIPQDIISGEYYEGIFLRLWLDMGFLVLCDLPAVSHGGF